MLLFLLFSPRPVVWVPWDFLLLVLSNGKILSVNYFYMLFQLWHHSKHVSDYFHLFLDSFGLWQVLAYTINLFLVILEIFLKQLLPKAFRCLSVSFGEFLSYYIKVEIHVSCCQGTAKLSLPLNCRFSMARVYSAAELICHLCTILLTFCFCWAEPCELKELSSWEALPCKVLLHFRL